jgi:hypothetical protein
MIDSSRRCSTGRLKGCRTGRPFRRRTVAAFGEISSGQLSIRDTTSGPLAAANTRSDSAICVSAVSARFPRCSSDSRARSSSIVRFRRLAVDGGVELKISGPQDHRCIRGVRGPPDRGPRGGPCHGRWSELVRRDRPNGPPTRHRTRWPNSASPRRYPASRRSNLATSLHHAADHSRPTELLPTH